MNADTSAEHLQYSDASRAALSDLIARLERATWPKLEYDRRIAVACGWAARLSGESGVELSNGVYAAPLRYTTFIDAALRLVPKGWGWHLGDTEDGRGSAFLWSRASDDIAGECFGATPAIALCIAALKARASAQSPSTEER